MLGTVYERQGKKNEAIAEFKAAINTNPDDHLALNALGYLYAEEGINLDTAEMLIRKALEFEPNNGAYLDSLGWVHFKKEMLDVAIEELIRAVALTEDPVIYEHLGDVYLKKSDRKKAKDNWQQALKLNPEQKSIQEKIERLNLTP
jgi:tetratricopeptide (TPR) repeat protein